MIMTRARPRRVALAGIALAAGAALLATTTPAAQADVGRQNFVTDEFLGTKMVVTYQSGEGDTALWTLDCDTSAGSHPSPERACAVLQSAGAEALPPTPPETPCTLQYGGPQTALITGTYRGKPILSHVSRSNGCEIRRWDALTGLLPAH